MQHPKTGIKAEREHGRVICSLTPQLQPEYLESPASWAKRLSAGVANLVIAALFKYEHATPALFTRQPMKTFGSSALSDMAAG